MEYFRSMFQRSPQAGLLEEVEGQKQDRYSGAVPNFFSCQREDIFRFLTLVRFDQQYLTNCLENIFGHIQRQRSALHRDISTNQTGARRKPLKRIGLRKKCKCKRKNDYTGLYITMCVLAEGFGKTSSNQYFANSLGNNIEHRNSNGLRAPPSVCY